MVTKHELVPELTELELEVIEAGLWEHIHGEPTGPMHRTCQENGVEFYTLFQSVLPLLQEWQAATLEIFIAPSFLRRPLPASWPWPNMTQQEIREDIERRARSRKRDG